MKEYIGKVYNSNQEILECAIEAKNEWNAFCKLIDRYNNSGLCGSIIRTEISEKKG